MSQSDIEGYKRALEDANRAIDAQQETIKALQSKCCEIIRSREELIGSRPSLRFVAKERTQFANKISELNEKVRVAILYLTKIKDGDIEVGVHAFSSELRKIAIEGLDRVQHAGVDLT